MHHRRFRLALWMGVTLPLAALPTGGCDRGISVSNNNNSDAATPECGNGTVEAAEQCDGPDLDGEDCVSRGFEGGTLACTAGCAFDLMGCVGGCGNGVTEGAEQCDASDLGGWNCWTAAHHTDGALACGADCTFDTSACHTCGDGVREAGEACDGDDLAGQDCESQGFAQGDLTCAPGCTLDTSACRGPTSCGDGVRDSDEACDGTDFGGATCASQGFTGGTLACTNACDLDLAGCTGGCGNGVAEGGEPCDGNDLGGGDCFSATGHTAGALACTATCAYDPSDCHTCGDGVREAGEACDGGDLDGQTCVGLGYAGGSLGCTSVCAFDSSACEPPLSCGDGVRDAWEECDGAALGGLTCVGLGYAGGTLGCTADCRYDQGACTHSICAPRTAQNPTGRPTVHFFTHSRVDAQIAAPTATVFQDAGPASPGAAEAAVTFDDLTPGEPVAGFLLTRTPAAGDALAEAMALIQTMPSATVTAADTLSPGSPVVSHDGYDTVVATQVAVQTSGAQTVVALRNLLVAQWLGRPAGDFTFPAPAGPTETRFTVSFATQWRSGALVAVTGAVARTSDYTGVDGVAPKVDDAGNGSGLARAAAQTATTCPTHVLTHLPMADIIWVVDETGSMYEEQQSIATNAVTFYNTAGAYGLDFRMGVVDVELANNGVFCTDANTSGDTFLPPGALPQFQACVLEPWGAGTQAGGLENGLSQGAAALTGHLPRANAPDRVRPQALLAIIYVTDEPAQEVADHCPTLDPACVQAEIAPTLAALGSPAPGAPASRAYAITGPPPASCPTAFLGSGYIEVVNAAGGDIHSICQADMGPPMMLILEDIIAASSPITLAHRPISATLAAAKEDNSVQPPAVEALTRSRLDGFDYRASSNGLVFINQSFSQLPYDIVVSYEYWLDPERCDNGADDDGDGLVDCADTTDCAGQVCGPHGQRCQGTQCQCAGGATETACGDGLDNDCDGLVDCADPDCQSPTCGNGAAECGEACDGADRRGATCDSLGYDGGALACTAGCAFDTAGCGAPRIYFWDDFEDSATTAGQWTFATPWQRGTPTGAGGEPGAAQQGSFVLGTTIGGIYPNNATYGANDARTGPIDLTTASAPELTFWAWYNVEPNYDGWNVWISTNGGTTWTPVPTVSPAYNGNEGGAACWYGISTGWVRHTVDLSAYAGQTVLLSLGLFTDTSVQRPGVYVDQLGVVEPGVLP